MQIAGKPMKKMLNVKSNALRRDHRSYPKYHFPHQISKDKNGGHIVAGKGATGREELRVR